MAEQKKFSRRTFLTAAAVALPVAGLAIVVPTALTGRRGVALWWNESMRTGDTVRATLNLHLPDGLAGTDDAKLFLDATTGAPYSITTVSATDPWRAFFGPGAPFQLFMTGGATSGAVVDPSTATATAADRSVVVVVDLTRLDAGQAPGVVRASCTGGDGTVRAEATLDLARPLFTRFA